MAVADDLRGSLPTYLPADRRQAMSDGQTLADRQRGTALFADIVGFTPLAEAMEHSFGPQRGAEELAAYVNGIFDALVDAVSHHHGSIVTFGGDSLMCWFEDGRERSAVACALEMQSAMNDYRSLDASVAGDATVLLKVALSHGDARRLTVGDPQGQLHDVLAGAAVDRASAGEKLCRPAEVVIDRALADALADAISVQEAQAGFARVTGLQRPVAPDPWPVPVVRPYDDYVFQPWLAPAVYSRVRAGQGQFLAEFRPVTVLFVAFGDIAFDDVKAGAGLDAFIRNTQEIVLRYGGSVFTVNTGDKGDHLLAVFGAPVARGDDLRRAVGAAYHLGQAHEGELRIGVHSGRVYAGLYAGRWRSAYTVLGDTVNLGARLMTRAGRGQILMSAAVGAALDRRFSIRALPPIDVKGRRAPVAVCELLGPATAGRSLTEPRYALPLVNRERELRSIDEALASARGGRGCVLSLTADPGLGKSRLIDAAIGRATREGFVSFAGACQPYGGRIAYLPWQPIWNGLFGLTAEAPDEARHEALASALATFAPDAVPLAPLLGTALDLGMEDNDATRGMPAPVRKQLLERILTGVLRGRAAGGPVCIALEDLHWVDSLSRDLLAAIAGAVDDLPILILLAYRPPEVGNPMSFPAQREVELAELGEEEASRMAAMLLAHMLGREPQPATVSAIVERANGNPFYIEELVREVVERGSTSDLPSSLQSVILARLDRLSESERLTARVASVIGRRFPTQWLIGAYGNMLEPGRIEQDLIGLNSSGLTVADTPAPDEAFLFRHIMVRDVAYETLSFRLRQDLHEQLAAYLEQSSDALPIALIAYHYARSANTAKEAVYRRLAAELAIRNGAYGDARAHVQRASDIVAGQPDGHDKVEQELELALLLGSILLVTDGQGSAQAKAIYDRARILAGALPPGPAVGRAIFGLWTYYLFQGLMGPTAELADEAVALAERSPDIGVRIMAHLAVAQTHMWTGQWDKCTEHFARVLELYDPADHQTFVTQYAQNPRFTASNSGFWGEWMLGNPERAAVVAEEAIAEARELHHEFTYTIAFLGRPLVAWFRRQNDIFVSSVGEYVATAQRSGNPFYIALSLSLDAMAKIVRGEFDLGLTQLRAQYDTMRALGSTLCDPLVVALLAEGYLKAGRYEEGIALLDETMPRFDEDGRISHVPDHLRLRAELLMARDPGAEGEALALLRRAIEVARAHKARSFELRAALSAAHVLAGRGQEEEAGALVAAAYAGFSEGFDDPDLHEARDLLS